MRKIAWTILLFILSPSLFAQNPDYLKKLFNKDSAQVLMYGGKELIDDETDITKNWMETVIGKAIVNLTAAMLQRGYSADDFDSLSAAIDQAAVDTAMVIVASRQTIAESTPDTVPRSVTLFVREGGRIIPTKKIVIEGKFIAGAYQVFEGSGIDSLIEFGPGSVDIVRPQWFGAKASTPQDSSDSYLAIQNAIKIAESSMEANNYDLGVYLSGGVYHVSDTLIISDHGLKLLFEDAIIRPYGTFTGPLVAIRGVQSTRTAKIPENWHRARVDVNGLYVDGINKARGIYVEDVMHGLFSNVHVERVSGYAVKMNQHKESVWLNLNIQTSNAASDSALLWIGDETGSQDGSNALVFIGPKITYCGGRYVYIGNSSSIKPRLINFIAPQFHHLDVDPANQNPNVSIDSSGSENVVWVENGENIHFNGGLIRMPAAPNGAVIKLGSAGNTPTKVVISKTKISSDADGVTGIDVISSGRITLDGAHFVLQGSGAKPFTSPQIWQEEINNPYVLKFDGTITTDQPGIVVANIASQSEYSTVNTVKDTFSVSLDVETLSEPAIIFYSSKGAKATISTNPTDNRLKFFDADFFEFDSTVVTKSGIGVGSGNLGGGDNVISITNGTIPTSNIPDGVLLYPEDVNSSSELKVRDESGAITILTENGTDQFGATATADTVLLPGVTASSVFIVSPRTSAPGSGDILSWSVNTDTLFVYRVSSTSGVLQYSWMRLR